MKKFLVLYMADQAEFEKMMKNATPEQQKQGMDAWMKWMGEHKASLVDGGAPLGKAKRVDAKGATDTKNALGGYSIVQAESAEAATKLFGKDQPHLQMPGAWIEITEIMPLPGM
jgi:YCII-related domain